MRLNRGLDQQKMGAVDSHRWGCRRWVINQYQYVLGGFKTVFLNPDLISGMIQKDERIRFFKQPVHFVLGFPSCLPAIQPLIFHGSNWLEC